MQARSDGRWLVGLFCVLAFLGAREAAAQPEEVEGTCSNYEVSPTSATVSGAGGSGTFDITWDWEAPDPGGICFINCTEASCSDPGFIVRSSATWLSGTNRNGVRVDYTVQAHTGASSRTGTLTVAGATFTVTQPGVTPCPDSPDSLSPSPLSFGGAGGMQDMTVAGRSDCTWTVGDDQDWIDTTPSSVSGGDTVTVEVDINPGDARTGSVTVGGRGVSVSQGELPPCTLSSLIVAPTSLSFGSGADSADVRATIRLRLLLCRLDLSVSDDRSWIAARVSSIAPPSLPWPELTGVTVTVTIDVDVNGGSSQRSGTVMIGSRSVTVTQNPPCPSSPRVDPTSLTFASGARETATVTLQEASSCRYAVTESLTWLSHRGSSPVAGNAMVTFRTETANTGTSPRLGEVSIGSTRVPVTQNPACPASPRVNPTSLTFASGARETATVTLQEASSCRYAVTESLTWLSHRGSSPVAGNAMVTFRTETANTGTSPRLGEVSIGSTRVPVTQNPACRPRPG